MITGYGVAESCRHFYILYGEDIRDKKVIVQGWGNVASAAAYYLSRSGARIAGIIDRAGGLIPSEPFGQKEIEKLFLNKQGNTLYNDELLSYEEVNERIWDVQADLFIPAAASRLVTYEQVQRMKNAGVGVISSGANVPFADKEIFFGPVMEKTDSLMTVIPDFISNCGMARVFAYLMGEDVKISDEAIFSDVSNTIRQAMIQVVHQCPNKVHFSREAFNIALGTLLK
jgi:glutamate dehydrogenase/leucine dehydrogenase